jgi:nucleoside-diphosphate-sugar epimerase
MSILVIGGAGFIGRRMVPMLVAAGHDVTCADIDVAGASAAFARLGDKVKVVRGDVTQFDDVIGAVQESRAERLINLSYFIGELAPHVAFKLDIQGMDNCFEAARRCGHGSRRARPYQPGRSFRGACRVPFRQRRCRPRQPC